MKRTIQSAGFISVEMPRNRAIPRARVPPRHRAPSGSDRAGPVRADPARTGRQGVPVGDAEEAVRADEHMDVDRVDVVAEDPGGAAPVEDGGDELDGGGV